MWRFVYLQGARKATGFGTFTAMPDLDAVYEGQGMPPFLQNRLLPESRPEYESYLSWLDLPAGTNDQFDILGATGGNRQTDCLKVFPCPEPTSDGRYVIRFFVHGLRHLGQVAIEDAGALDTGDPLFLLLDVQNPHDPDAIMLRTDFPPRLIGYIPRYRASDVRRLLETCGRESVTVKVVSVNRTAPIRMRFLCELEAPWPQGFRPCDDETFDPIPDSVCSNNP